MRRRSMPAPSARPKASRPCGSASSGSPCHAMSKGGGGGACTITRPRCRPSSTPACTSRTRASSRAAHSCVDHRGKTRGRWRRQSALAQEPAQEIARAMMRAARSTRRGEASRRRRRAARRSRRDRRPGARPRPDARRRARAWPTDCRRSTPGRASPSWRTALRRCRVCALLSSSTKRKPAAAAYASISARAMSSRGRHQTTPRGSSRSAAMRRQAVRPRAAEQLQEQRLRLVVAVMRERHEAHLRGERRRGERRVARAPGLAFEARAAAHAARRPHSTVSGMSRVAHSDSQNACHSLACGDSP